MTHLIARHPNGIDYIHRDHPDFAEHAVEVSGQYKHVRMWNDGPRGGNHHQAETYVPVEHVDQFVATAYSRQHRNGDTGDLAWDHVEVDDDLSGWADPDEHLHVNDGRGGATMLLTAVMKVIVANAYIAAATWLGLTSTTPTSTTGTEISGGSPAYARVAASWGTPSGTTGVTTGTPGAINVASGTTVVGVQYWNASTAGTYEDGATVTSQAFASQGTYTVSPTLTPS